MSIHLILYVWFVFQETTQKLFLVPNKAL